MTVGVMVLVTDWPPRTATLSNVPRGTATAACAMVGVNATAKRASAPVRTVAIHTYAVRHDGESGFLNLIRVVYSLEDCPDLLAIHTVQR